MPAFNRNVFYSLTSAHSTLRDRMLALHKITIDPKKIVTALVPEQDITVLKRAAELGLRGSVYSSSISFRHDTVNKITIDCNNVGFPLPKSVAEEDHTLDSNWSFSEKLTEWGDRMAATYFDFELGEEVLQMLQDRCTSPKQVRYVLPGIVTLCSIAGQDELANKLAVSGALRDPPTLPPGSRQAVMDYNALIAKASLLPERTTEPRRVSFRYSAPIVAPWKAFV